jgi:hypothetical protein
MDKGSVKIKVLAVVVIIIVAVIGIPLSYDQFAGRDSIPGSFLYDLEKAGEDIKYSLALNKKYYMLELAGERDQEASALKEKLISVFDEDEILRINILIIEAENRASRLRIEALRD